MKLFALRDKDEAEEKDDESEEILHAETLFGVGDGAFPGNFDGTLALGLRVKGSHRVEVRASELLRRKKRKTSTHEDCRTRISLP